MKILSIFLSCLLVFSQTISAARFLAPPAVDVSLDKNQTEAKDVKEDEIFSGNPNEFLAALENENSSTCKFLKAIYLEDYKKRRARFINAIEAYIYMYPKVEVIYVCRAPGMITGGDHASHADALSSGMPARQDIITIIGINPDSNDKRVVLQNRERKKYRRKEYASAEVVLGLKFEIREKKSDIPWYERAAATIQQTLMLGKKYGKDADKVPGLYILVDGVKEDGGVPVDSDMSSSTSLEMSILYPLQALMGLKGKFIVGEVVQAGRNVEADFGIDCSILDQCSIIGGLVAVEPGKFVGVNVNSIPMLDEYGRQLLKVDSFPIPGELKAALVYTGRRINSQYQAMLTAGELASYILSQHFDELVPDFQKKVDQNKLRKACDRDDGATINEDHNGKPFLFQGNDMYPVFYKPAFFTPQVIEEFTGIEVTYEEIEKWIRSVLRKGKIMRGEMINKLGLSEEYYDEAIVYARKAGVNVNSLGFSHSNGYDLLGAVLHPIGEHIRALEAAEVLRKADESKGAERAKWIREYGRIQDESYKSLRDLFGNATARIKNLQRWAVEQDWCMGYRHFGEGYGGWVEVWINPEADYKDVEIKLKEHLKGLDWYEELAKEDRDTTVENQLEFGVQPFNIGYPASLLSYKQGDLKGSTLPASVGDVSEVAVDKAQ